MAKNITLYLIKKYCDKNKLNYFIMPNSYFIKSKINTKLSFVFI